MGIGTEFGIIGTEFIWNEFNPTKETHQQKKPAGLSDGFLLLVGLCMLIVRLQQAQAARRSLSLSKAIAKRASY